MKLHELLEDIDSFNKMVTNVRSSTKRTVLGSGRENAVYSKTTQPTTAYRVGQSNEASAFLLRSLAQKPFGGTLLPHVRATKDIKGGLRVSVTDKLLPMTAIKTVDELIYVARQAMGDDAIKLADYASKSLTSAFEVFATNVFWYLEHKEYAYTKFTQASPQLEQVRQYLHQLIQSAGAEGINAHIDHATIDNLMLRPASGGYQLVINDPLTSSR